MSTGAPAFLERYERLAGRLPGDSALRAAAAAAFRDAGLPGGTQQRRIEAWKFTSLRPVAETKFPAGHRAAARGRNDPGRAALAGRASHRVRRWGRVIAGATSSSGPMPCPGMAFARFAEQPDFGTLSWPDREPMVALNTMLAADGAALHVPAGHDGGMVQLVSIAAGDADFHPRHSIRLDKGAKLTLVEISAGQGTYLLNTVAEIHVAAGRPSDAYPAAGRGRRRRSMSRQPMPISKPAAPTTASP